MPLATSLSLKGLFGAKKSPEAVQKAPVAAGAVEQRPAAPPAAVEPSLLPIARAEERPFHWSHNTSKALRVVAREELYLSEPDPSMFGNEPNPSRNRDWTNWNWLQSRFHFRFAECRRGPASYGVLRVLNDDLVQPARGFGAHGHQDMEIVTLVVEGYLTHKDSMGENETLPRGSIQFMSAGRGVRHSEHNHHKTLPLRFIQCWIMPRRMGTKPNYGSMPGDTEAAKARFGRWAHLVSDVQGPARTPVQINQDCNAYLAELGPGESPGEFELLPGRQGYLLCVEGSATGPNGASLRRHDAAELKGPATFSWTAGAEGAMLLLFEMALTADSRYRG